MVPFRCLCITPWVVSSVTPSGDNLFSGRAASLTFALVSSMLKLLEDNGRFFSSTPQIIKIQYSILSFQFSVYFYLANHYYDASLPKNTCNFVRYVLCTDLCFTSHSGMCQFPVICSRKP